MLLLARLVSLFPVFIHLSPTGSMYKTHCLTRREQEVLDWMSNGLTQKEIANQLFVSPSTINTHLRNIYEKLNVHSGIHAVAVAIRNNII